MPYSPQFNGIEYFWSALKTNYRKLVLKQLLSKGKYDISKTIL